ncbi:Cilia- and flagella-associated protein 44 isoform X3 [Oopsacas minuta]|uniref:Cilia- and flagella-associated protein 44 isoform X3 n=1 Tax=Oopsacas minuta TaxID=111878 RepID=A0AAV7JRK1_9METZ|nr:Cilia- and flagella-associated protein 44 isoform X3 [Oopsacas minuta]
MGWRHEAIVLRTKAFSQDIFRVSFSPENEGILTSSGIGHIRFWKMVTTFAGLKLQGDIGKFGKKEISDVSGYAEFLDGKVLSGTEWGNLLLWEGDLVKVELCRKNQKPCHVEAKKFLGRTTFNIAPTCVAWLPLWFDASGLSIIAGFCDGIIRLLHITGEDGQSPLSTDKIEDDSSFTLKQVLKPHSKPVSAILLGDNCSNLNLVTSADNSILFRLQKDQSANGDTLI